MEKKTRKDRENRRKKYDIIQAAVTTFSLKGFHGSTMAEISSSSEFPLATIYKLFKSKEQIYFELLSQKSMEHTSTIEQSMMIDKLNPLEKIKNGLNAHYIFCIGNKDFTKIYLEERQRLEIILKKNHQEKVRLLLAKLFNLFAKVFQEGIDKKIFKPYFNKDMSELLIGMTTSALSNWIMFNEDEERLKAKFKMCFEIFTKGICKE